MRLLRRDGAGDYSLTEDLASDNVPPYAILSHTWGIDEVVFADLAVTPGDWQRKDGYSKIEFCADQAKRDGLQHFWVDTCCIDKSNSIELQTAINSMFRWYRGAQRCYVYLADVSDHVGSSQQNGTLWQDAFRQSRWFTRGWTLQELIAPKTVDFYSKEGTWLGNKQTLESMLRDITGIPASALRGTPLSDFTVSEREAWVRDRQTKYEEDLAYSLLGIFDVHMPLIYGEGREKARRRLREEAQKIVKGDRKDYFSITFSLSEVPDTHHFVARERETAEMRSSLSSDGSRRVVTLQGLGGIGKTQLAVAYIKRYRDEYSAIFWMNIKDEQSIQQSFSKVASRILQQYPGDSSLSTLDLQKDHGQVVAAVKAWLSMPGNTRWLIVYDNYDNPRLTNDQNDKGIDIRRFLPTAYQGSIIITTRLAQVDIGHPIRIRKLESMDDSLKILSSTSGRAGLYDDGDAKKLVQMLDGLPLALATAGAYLRRVSTSLIDYIRHYDKSWARLHTGTPKLGSYEDRTLCSTWQVSYQQVQEQDPLAAHLLQWWAYFNNEDLWFELLQDTPEDAPEWLHDLADELNFNNAMGTLHDYGFVELHIFTPGLIESRGYSIHSCLHSWTIHILNQEWNSELSKFAIKCIASHVPLQDDAPFWFLQRRILPHARMSCVTRQSSDDGLLWAFYNIAYLYASQDKLHEAEEMYVRALRGYEEAFGPHHTFTLDTVNNIGLLCKAQGKLQEAERMYLRVLQGYERALGPDHQLILKTVNNLGSLYKAQGKLQEAERMYLRALQGKEEALGSDHMSTLNTVNNLGILYVEQGKLQEGEKMYLRALQGKEGTLGPDHVSTLNTVNNLGILYVDQGKLQEAEEMYLRALQGREVALGSHHTSTLDTVNNLGLLYVAQGKLQEAKDMYLRALQGREKILGPCHTPTLDTVNNLGLLYVAQDKLQEAEEMYLRALHGYENAIGPDHTSTLSTVNNLGILYANQGKLQEAEKMHLRALQGKEQALGPGHTSTLDTVNNLGILSVAQGKLQEAEKMHLRALQGKEEALGPGHTSTLDTVNNLGLLYVDQGKLQEAEEMYLRAFHGYENAIGYSNITRYRPAINTARGLAALLRSQGHLIEADRYYQIAYSGLVELLGPLHKDVQTLQNTLQDLRRGMEAECPPTIASDTPTPARIVEENS